MAASIRNYSQMDATPIVPAQWWIWRPTPQTPESRLMAALVTDAVECLWKYRGSRNRRGSRLFREAADWVFENAPDACWPFSFEVACEAIGLNADSLRDQLRPWCEADEADIGSPQAACGALVDPSVLRPRRGLIG